MFKSYYRPEFINIIASPFVLAIPILLAILFFVPNPNQKYKLIQDKKEAANKKNSATQFYDLNSDGDDERVTIFHNYAKYKAALKVLTPDGDNYEQWNMNGYYSYIAGSFSCQDLNKDGYGEIYVIYYRADSVFLSGIQPYPNKEWIFKDLFITKVWEKNSSIDYMTDFAETVDMDSDGFDELIFTLKAGFSRQPRSFYIFNLQTKDVIASPSIGANIALPIIADLNNDEAPEFYVGSSTPGNIPDTMSITLHDYSSWLLVYDKDLKWMYPPIETVGYPSGVRPIMCIQDKQENKYILWSIWKKGQDGDILQIYNYKQELIKTFPPIPGFQNHSQSQKFIYKDQTLYFIGSDPTDFIFIDQNLQLYRIPKSIDNTFFLKDISDLNKDGQLEYIFQTINLNYIIYDNNLRNPVKLETGVLPHTTKNIFDGIKHNKAKPNQFFYKTDQYIYLYSYEFNPYFYLKYPLWLLLYFLIAGILWLTQYFQRLQSKKRVSLENTINQLQMMVLKNQMDPHFMFNVLNGIAAGVRKGEKVESYNHIIRFSQLLRALMKRVDKLDVSLEDEISFVRNYLELERFRFEAQFEYSIEIDPKIDPFIRIPRMLIQLLVENSIKHGLSSKSDVKIVEIKAIQIEERIEIRVKDNGIGREAAKEKSTDSGNGLQIMKEMIRLYKKTTGTALELHYQDLRDEKGEASGTLAVVSI